MFFEDLTFRPPDVPARRPARDETSVWEGLGAAYTAEVMETDSWNRKDRTEAGVYDEIRDRLESVLGKDEFDRMLAERIPRRTRNPDKFKREAIAEILEEQAGQFPDQFKDIPTSRDTIEAETQRRYQEEYQDAIETLDYMRDWQGVTNFVGRGAAAITDPTSLAMMLIPVGAGGSVARILGREALLGAAGEAAILPRQFEMAEYLDIEDPNIALQIAMGAGFAGALAGGFKASTRRGRRQISAELARALNYASGRNHTIPADATLRGQEAEAAIDAAEDALVNDQMPTQAAVEAPQVEDVPWDIPEAPPRATEAPAGPDPMEQALEATLRDLERDGAETRPVLKRILSKSGDVRDQSGGVLDTLRLDPQGFVAGELKARGITTRSMPNLFRKGGRTNLDNLVASEWEKMFPGIIEATGTPASRLTDGGYLDEQGLIDLLSDELSGNPSRLRSQQDYQRAQGELEDYLRLRDEPKETIEPLPDSDDAYAMMQGMKEIKLKVDDAVRLRGLEPIINEAERNEMARYLAQNGGTVDDLIEMSMARDLAFGEGVTPDAGDFEFAPYRESDVAPRDVPDDAGLLREGPGGGAGRLENAGAAGRGAEGGAEGGGFRSESTPEGDQLVVPGAERVQTSAAQDARAEMAARQQQSRLGRLGQTRVEDDAGTLFGDPAAHLDLFQEGASTPAASKLNRGIVADIRTELEAEGDFELSLTGEAGNVRSASSILDDLAKDEDFVEIAELCGLGRAT